jgi:ribonuclease R
MTKRKRGKSKKGLGNGPDAGVILRIFREGGKPLSEKDLQREIGLPNALKQDMHEVLKALEAEGKLIRVQKGWGLVESMRLITGVLEISRSGVGYVLPADTRRKDIFIHPKDIGDAWHGTGWWSPSPASARKKITKAGWPASSNAGVKTLPCRVVKRMARTFFCAAPPTPATA